MWRKSESTIKPQLVDTSDPVTCYVRKNITEYEKEGVTYYQYDELAVPKDDWLYFVSIMEVKEALSEQEEIIAEELVNQMDIVATLDAHEEMLAEILLNTL